MYKKNLMRERVVKGIVLLIVDVMIIGLGYILSFIFKSGLREGVMELTKNLYMFPLLVSGYIVPLYFGGMYKSIWKLAGIHEAMRCFWCSLIGLLFTLIVMKIGNNLRLEAMVLAAVIIFLGISFVRLFFRIYRRVYVYKELLDMKGKVKTLIIGAGSSGNTVILEMLKNNTTMVPVGIIDDNLYKKGKKISGIEVLGTRNDIEEIVAKYEINLIVIAISNIKGEEKGQILKICAKTKAKVRIIPGVSEILEGKISLAKMREVDFKDLLGRNEIMLDEDGIRRYIENRVVLITGGGGSIGAELCRQVVKYNPKKLIVLDIYENNAYDIQNELMRNYPDVNLKVIIATVRDRYRLEKIFKEEKINIVFHAAAHKHVPLMEENPEEAIKNNVIGTLNLAECADRFNVNRFVLISTDKAVNPTNVMGATKRLCEMIIQGLDRKSKTKFVAVRFGNVLGSNGSVVPLFKEQIKEGGPVTLTHKEITRYFMLIEEAARLVLQAGAYANGGEIFVLDMGKPVKIYDLAKNLIRLSGLEVNKDIKIEITGLRKGEKLYEELLMSEEGLAETENQKIFVGKRSNIEFSELKKMIAKLVRVMLNEDKDELKKALKSIVPTYVEKKEK